MADVSSNQDNEKIAIVGMGCRLPGDVDSPMALWRFLLDRKSAIGEVPSDRWSAAAFSNSDPGARGKISTSRGGFLSDIAAFDAGFFGISPREAHVMDPQHRLLLECAWQAIEDAGLQSQKLAGSATGVYVGISHSDYHSIQMFGRKDIDLHSATGGALSIASARISHRFDLKGPSLAIDTACSSSLVALDAACKAILSGDCEQAFVGGVNAILAPDVSITFSRASMLSPDGQCRTFDAGANGYVRGEGAAVIFVKKLSKAIADGDRIHAVISATAVNQDGHTSTITVPSFDSQVAMLNEACKRAGVSPADVGYVEAHGTGTPVGDPIEANAIGTVFGKGRKGVCKVGSIKTNLGHLEPAAGVVGLIKAVLCVREGHIPASLNFEIPNPHIDFEQLNLAVVDRETAWPQPAGRRVAAVNSFGFGGTNACAVVEQYVGRPLATRHIDAKPTPVVLPISAATPAALRKQAGLLAGIIDRQPEEIANLASTLAYRRSHLSSRAVIVAKSAGDALGKLTSFANGSSSGVVEGILQSRGRTAFVFTGQGAQWWGMGRGLLRDNVVFRQRVEACDAIFRRLSGWSLLDQFAVGKDAARIDETAVAQPTTFAVQVGLAACLAELGVRPDAVVGHSIGEIAAAHAAGALSLEDAVTVVYHRSRLQEMARHQGAMAAVGLSENAVQFYLAEFGPELEVAAVNGSQMVTLAGPRHELETFVGQLKSLDERPFCQMLRIDYAFHSRQMDRFKAELVESLFSIRPKAPDIEIFSTVTGSSSGEMAFDGAYWARNMRDPVLFNRAVTNAIEAGCDTFVELGSHPALTVLVSECLEGRSVRGVAVSTLRRDLPDDVAMARAAASLHVDGVEIDWRPLIAKTGNIAELPPYPWERERYWSDSEDSRAARFDEAVHALLGMKQKTAYPSWQNEIDSEYPAYLRDHVVDGTVVFPAAGYIETMLAAAREVAGEVAFELEDVVFHEALTLSSDTVVVFDTSVESARNAVRIRTRMRDSQTWTDRASARIRSIGSPPAPLPEWQPVVEPPDYILSNRFYRVLNQEGHQFGKAFRGIKGLWRERGEALAEVHDLNALTADKYILHPALLDSCFQVIRAFDGFDKERGDVAALPIGVDRFRLYRKPTSIVYSRATAVRDDDSEVAADISIFTESGELIAELRNFRCRRIMRVSASSITAEAPMWRERWLEADREVADEKTESEQLSWLVVAHDEELAGHLAVKLKANEQASKIMLPLSLSAAVDSNVSVISVDRVLYAVQPRQDLRNLLEHLVSISRSLASLTKIPRLYAVILPAEGTVGLSPANLTEQVITGFFRTLGNEVPDLRPSIIACTDDCDVDSAILEVLTNSDQTEVRYTQGQRYVAILEGVSSDALPTPLKKWSFELHAPAFKLGMPTPGSLANLRFNEVDIPAPKSGELLVQVHAASLNFRDVMAATGLLPAAAEKNPAWQHLGLECAGTVVAAGGDAPSELTGKRVVAIVPGAFASHVCVPAHLLFPIPDGISFAEAVAIPTAYATARYALLTLARLCAGERILIHAATGGVGLAAVAIAMSVGAEVYATAGSAEKQNYLRSLGVKHIFSSRNLAFADEIMRSTDGRGVDAVLNSLPGEYLERSLELLSPGGRFLEIGKRDIYADSAIGLRVLRRNCAFFAIDLSQLANDRPDLLQAEIAEILKDIVASRLPLPSVQTFGLSQVVNAFETMAKAKHIGKVVVSFEGEASISSLPKSRVSVDPNGIYVITGGAGGLGLATAEYLYERGARNLVLAGRSQHLPSESAAFVESLRSSGCNVLLVSADVSTREGVAVIDEAVRSSGMPLRGIVHAAGTISDGLISQLGPEQLSDVFDGKVTGALRLHDWSRSHQLDFFLLYSSVASVVGSIGQAHYAAANLALDGIAQHRRENGLPAISVAWGPVGDRGYLTKRPDVARQIQQSGMQLLNIATVYDTLDRLLQHDVASIAAVDVDWSRLGRLNSGLAFAARTRVLARAAGRSSRDGPQFIINFLDFPENERADKIKDFLRQQVAGVLKIDSSGIETDRPLSDFGLDSLTSFELKSRIETQLGLSLPIGSFLQRPTIDAIVPAIAERLTSGDGASASATTDKHDVAEMSPGQEALWFIDQASLSNPAYILAMAVTVRPRLDVELAANAVSKVIAAHDGLRMVFQSDSLGPLASTLLPDAFKLSCHEASALDDNAFKAMLEREAHRPFNLEQGPLIRVNLFHREDHDVLMLAVHHIVADATSIAIVVEDMFEHYFALRAGVDLNKPPSYSFSSFARWQRSVSESSPEHRSFWIDQLSELTDRTTLPRASKNLSVSGPGASLGFKIDRAVTTKIKAYAREQGVTIFSALFAIFNTMLARRTGAADVIVGTPVSARTKPEHARLVGYVTNVLPVRSRLVPGETFANYLVRSDAALRTALEHQDYPFPTIVRDVAPARQPGRSPLFDTMFSMERSAHIDENGFAVTLLNAAGPSLTIKEFEVQAVELSRQRAPVDLNFIVEEFDGMLYGLADYRSDYWDVAFIEELTSDFCLLADKLVSHPDQSAFAEVSMRSMAHGPVQPHLSDVVADMRAMVKAHPHKTAASAVDGELSYQELWERAERLAGMLDQAGVTAERPIALCLKRTSHLLVAMVASLMCGVPFAPLDPGYPAKRKQAILDDIKPLIVLVDDSTAGEINEHTKLDVTAIPLDVQQSIPARDYEGKLAYIIHTSGSTGRPVGVEVERAGLNNFLEAIRTLFGITHTDRLLAVTTISFDIAMLELLLPLTVGATISLADEVDVQDGSRLCSKLERGDVTVLQATPATWQMLVDAGWAGSQQLLALCGGEALPVPLANEVSRRCKAMWNMFGPTETTVWSTASIVAPDSSDILIGVPLINTSCVVVDEAMEPVPSGTVGELLIGGVGLARGYFNQPERTSERFVNVILDGIPVRMFRSGDRVVMNRRGELTFVGRRDDQIKIRGHRIELREVEAVLRSCPGITGAAVVVAGETVATRHLVAAISCSRGLSVDRIRSHCAEYLPRSMQPAEIRILDALPRLPNNKIDRRAILAARGYITETAGFEWTPVERQLTSLLAEIFGRQPESPLQNFFEAGGTSLLGMRYIVRASNLFGVELNAIDLVSAPTIRAMAEVIQQRLDNTNPGQQGFRRASEVSALWKPLALKRVESDHDPIDAAAIAYLPDSIAARFGNLPVRLSDYASAWLALGRTALGSTAVIVAPVLQSELADIGPQTIHRLNQAIAHATRLGAKTVSLTGIIPSVTDFGRQLVAPEGTLLTTGHATTVSSVVMTVEHCLAITGRSIDREDFAVVGIGAIGEATVRALLASYSPHSLTLCDVPSQNDRLCLFADSLRNSGFGGPIRIALASGRCPNEVYDASVIIGASNVPGILDVARLKPGTIVVDDSFPHIFDAKLAEKRVSHSADVLIVEGGSVTHLVKPDWKLALPAVTKGWIDRAPIEAMTPAADMITGCILSALVTAHSGAPATVGPITTDQYEAHRDALRQAGFIAAKLHIGHFAIPDELLQRFANQFGGSR